MCADHTASQVTENLCGRLCGSDASINHRARPKEKLVLAVMAVPGSTNGMPALMFAPEKPQEDLIWQQLSASQLFLLRSCQETVGFENP